MNACLTQRLETLDSRTGKIGEEEAVEADRIDTTTEETCLVDLANLVDSDLVVVEEVVVAADEEAAGDEEVVVDVEAVTVVDADSLRAIGVTVARAKGIGGDACHPDGNRSGS